MYVYFVRAGNRGAIKIGLAMNLERRLAQLQVGNQFELKLIASIPCKSRKEAESLESQLHKRFERQCIRGEWFQGNIDFRRIRDPMIDTDDTRSSLTKPKSTYKHKKNAKKLRLAKRAPCG